MNKITIMQPYLFPYIGYFQLLEAVEQFIFYDDVNYITRGWINRNKILINEAPKYFTVPCKDASQNKIIYDVEHALDERKREKMLKKIRFAYSRAPFFDRVFPVFKSVVEYDTPFIADMAIASIKEIADYVGLECAFDRSSQKYKNTELSAAERLIDICKIEECETYINPIGGQELYEKENFKDEGIDLFFLEPELIEYEQFGEDFVPGLSILDVLMFNDPDFVKNNLLTSYKLH